MMPPMQAGSLANRAALTRLQQPQQPGPPEPPPMQPTAQPAPTQPQPTAPQPVQQPAPISSFRESAPPQRSYPGQRVNSGQNGMNIGRPPSGNANMYKPYQPATPQPQQPQVMGQPTQQPMPGQAQAQQQRSQQMLRSAEETNLKGRQSGKFQEGLQRFGGDRTQALHYALKYGA